LFDVHGVIIFDVMGSNPQCKGWMNPDIFDVTKIPSTRRLRECD